MRCSLRSVWLCIALGAATATAHDYAWPPADLALVHSARLWEMRSRGDLAQLALQKLIAARPDSPEALVELGELDLRIGELDGAARVLAQLQRRFTDSQTAQDFEVEYRLATRDRLQIATVRRLIQMRRDRQALESLRALFAHGVPNNAMGIEYYRLLAGTPNGWQQALQGLQRLAREHQDDPNYPLALARQMLERPEYTTQGLEILGRLAQRDDVRISEVDQSLAAAFRNAPAGRVPTQVLHDYLQRHPNDARALRLLARQRHAVEQQRLLMSDGLASTEPALQQELVRRAMVTLEARTTDAIAQRILLMTRLLTSASAPASVPLTRHLDDESIAAAQWWNRAQQAMLQRQLEVAAAEMQAALAFHGHHEESAIASAEQLERLGATPESGALLADASQFDPQSRWLFETRVRWMIAHDEAAQAIVLLRQRALTDEWTADSRDALLGQALDQRAAERNMAGDVDAAITDWRAAIRLLPRDPWIRYRLAGVFQSRHEAEEGVALLDEGIAQSPLDPQMRYATALFLSNLTRYEPALQNLEAVSPASRSEAMNALHDRLTVAMARTRAEALEAAGDRDGARAELLGAEPLAARHIDQARDLAYAWIGLGEAGHGLALFEPYLAGSGGESTAVLLTWAQLLDSAQDTGRLPEVLARLRVGGVQDADQIEVVRLQRALDLRVVRKLERDGQFEEAARRLDEMLASTPADRSLREARAELDLSFGRPRPARDRLAALVAEQPENVVARLAYVRALTESGDLALARLQLLAVQDRIPTDDFELQLNFARRQLELGDTTAALATLKPLLGHTPARADVLILAARAELLLRHYSIARGYLREAQQTATGSDALNARRSAEEIDARLQSSVAAAVQLLYQPGITGVSQLDIATVPSYWVVPLGYEQRLTAHIDAVLLSTGRLAAAYSDAALLGKVQAFGPSAPLRYSNDQQAGVALSGGYRTDVWAADVGTTPLGFNLPNVVGGIEWTPNWHSLDVTLGLARRAVTSSALSYAGLRDPITGEKWGGVVASGPYAGLALYRERFSVSGSLRFSELTGTDVASNQFVGARAAGSWKLYSNGAQTSAYAGVVLNDWNYQHNLSNYTFGSGGYYSPHSYLSTALPVELIGQRAGWSYQLRASVAYSVSTLAAEDFYPNDLALQGVAARMTLPTGFASPVFGSTHGGAFSISAYAALERQIGQGLVLGAMLDIDRTDFYHPTVVSLYLRHAFSPFATPLAVPPQPTRPYNP